MGRVGSGHLSSPGAHLTSSLPPGEPCISPVLPAHPSPDPPPARPHRPLTYSFMITEFYFLLLSAVIKVFSHVFIFYFEVFFQFSVFHMLFVVFVSTFILCSFLGWIFVFLWYIFFLLSEFHLLHSLAFPFQSWWVSYLSPLHDLFLISFLQYPFLIYLYLFTSLLHNCLHPLRQCLGCVSYIQNPVTGKLCSSFCIILNGYPMAMCYSFFF